MNGFANASTSAAAAPSGTRALRRTPSSGAAAGAGHVAGTRSFPRTAALARPGSRPGPAHRHLAAMLERSAFVLHDIAVVGAAVPSIDHVAVGTSGVWVIASRPIAVQRVRIHRPLLGPSTLRVGGADHTALIDLLDRHRTFICGALADVPHVPLHTALSFTGGQFPLLGTLTLGGHAILRPAELAKRVAARGPIRRSESREVAGLLHERLAG